MVIKASWSMIYDSINPRVLGARCFSQSVEPRAIVLKLLQRLQEILEPLEIFLEIKLFANQYTSISNKFSKVFNIKIFI